MKLNSWYGKYPILKESEHYRIVRNISVDPSEIDVPNYLLIYRDQETIEAHSHAYVIILMHMLDAEAAYDNVMANFESTKPVRALDAVLN